MPDGVCDRFRMIASLRLDAEVSPLEAALAEAHAARCTACRAYADELSSITTRIRTAPPQRLRRQRLHDPSNS